MSPSWRRVSAGPYAGTAESLSRTGCCGCPISYKAVEDLEKIRPYEPNLVRAAWNVFGQSYEYRARYVEYKKRRAEAEKCLDGQLDLFGGEVGA